MTPGYTFPEFIPKSTKPITSTTAQTAMRASAILLRLIKENMKPNTLAIARNNDKKTKATPRPIAAKKRTNSDRSELLFGDSLVHNGMDLPRSEPDRPFEFICVDEEDFFFALTANKRAEFLRARGLEAGDFLRVGFFTCLTYVPLLSRV